MVSDPEEDTDKEINSLEREIRDTEERQKTGWEDQSGRKYPATLGENFGRKLRF